MMYTKVKQEDSTGCGIACIAMISNKKYSEVKALAVCSLSFNINGPFYTKASDLNHLAGKLHITLGKKRVPYTHGISSLPERAILAINYKENTDTWHWVVYFKHNGQIFILDPNSKHEVRKDIDRVLNNTKWYIKIK